MDTRSPSEYLEPRRRTTVSISALIACGGLLLGACGSDDASTDATAAATSTTTTPTETASSSDAAATDTTEANATGDASVFQIDVWADNWMSVWIDGTLIGEDSVPITTERSFNKETFTFEASYPFTVAIEAKDFKETDSGIEYIGQDKQQMGDGGLIAQITDTTTGDVVAATDASWTIQVIQRAPLNTECEKDPDPDATCQFEAFDAPSDWTSATFDDSGWTTATEWSAADVGPKDGYDEIAWDPTAQLVWGTDLEVDNTVLFRSTISN